ncbi:uncharacterized protein CCOS01_16450 [Colletotrichum costaricense]|uniref:Uncharacterized protein n=1 Tax=Colletotrichum costaricense TaxID=1209916 RepID=A0AAI9YFJ6_9PEZI|nr:uncharacterized protein CCOS01_16450 [Colletotrichum costaricense]KAK1506591.1 hypothetical protein CCOS01_16450 [Colletotrichum costaricense]
MGDFGMWLCVAAATQTTSSCSGEPANQLASPLLLDRAAGALLTSNAFGSVTTEADKYLWAGAGTFWWMPTRPGIASAQVKFNVEPRGLILWRLRLQRHHDSANCTQHCPYGVKIDTTTIDAYQTYLNFTFEKYFEKSYGGPYPVIMMPDASMCGFWTGPHTAIFSVFMVDLMMCTKARYQAGISLRDTRNYTPPRFRTASNASASPWKCPP